MHTLVVETRWEPSSTATVKRVDDAILSFVNVRDPQTRTAQEAGDDRLDLYGSSDRYITVFGRDLFATAQTGDLDGARSRAAEHLDEFGLPADLNALALQLSSFDSRVSAFGARPTVAAVTTAVAEIFNETPQEVVARASFATTWQRLADSVLAVFFSPGGGPTAQRAAHLVRGLRLCALLARLAGAGASAAADLPARTLRALVSIPLSDETLRSLQSVVASPLTALYRLRSPAGHYLYTTSPSERYEAVHRYQNVDEGVACYVFPVAQPGTVSLFRLYHPGAGDHFYTTSYDERNNALANSGYTDEGVACYVHLTAAAGTAPFHRLFSGRTGDHLYTTSTTERDSAIDVDGYVPEGTEGHVYLVPITAGGVRPASVGDLLIVRQRLRRYDRGEIAHVENALRGEHRKRVHQRTSTTETTLLQETETTTDTEKDLQTTERFELKREASRTVREDMAVQAGLTVTASYGAVTASASGEFSFNRATEEATRSASSYARDVVERSRTRLQERELERRTRRVVETVDETNEHGLDNTGDGAEDVVGVYRWIDKVFDAQMVNYGRRLMLEFTVPEPAAYYRELAKKAQAAARSPSMPKPSRPAAPGSTEDLRPELVEWPAIQQTAATYGVTDLQPPPPDVQTVGVSLEVPFTDRDYAQPAPIGYDRVLPALGATKVSADLKVPKGYTATQITWSGSSRAYIRKHPEQNVSSAILEYDSAVSVGSATTDGLSGNSTEVAGFVEFVPVAVVTSAAAVVVTFKLACKRTDEHYEVWQSKTYDAIMLAYQDALARYDDELNRLAVQAGIAISSLPDAENRRIESHELRRAVLSILTGQQFETLRALDDASSDGSLVPLLILDHAAALGDVVTYFEQAFEWQNMTYIFYPYFWGRRSTWSDVLAQSSTDPVFTHFLQAGYARVQLPVRPKFDLAVLYYLCTSRIWAQPEDSPLPAPYLPLVEEIRNQTGDDFTVGTGRLGLTAGSPSLTGAGTSFNADDVDRELRVAGRVYRIVDVQSPNQIDVEPAPTTAAAAQQYSLGPRLVGPSWEVRLPTTLVMIDRTDVVLPSWPA
jgi:hypothetical protein